MANITKAQVEKLNSKMSNGWEFDWYYFLTHSGEKIASKKIEIDDKHFYKAEIWFSESYHRYEKEITMKLHISEFTKSDATDFASSVGMGISKTIGRGYSKKMFSEIQKATANFTDDDIIKLAREHDAMLKDEVLLDGNGWHINEVC